MIGCGISVISASIQARFSILLSSPPIVPDGRSEMDDTSGFLDLHSGVPVTLVRPAENEMKA